MLVVSRKQGEKLMIGNDTEVVILGIKGNRVQIGVQAPTTTKILRGRFEPHLSSDVKNEPGFTRTVE